MAAVYEVTADQYDQIQGTSSPSFWDTAGALLGQVVGAVTGRGSGSQPIAAAPANLSGQPATTYNYYQQPATGGMSPTTWALIAAGVLVLVLVTRK